MSSRWVRLTGSRRASISTTVPRPRSATLAIAPSRCQVPELALPRMGRESVFEAGSGARAGFSRRGSGRAGAASASRDARRAAVYRAPSSA